MNFELNSLNHLARDVINSNHWYLKISKSLLHFLTKVKINIRVLNGISKWLYGSSLPLADHIIYTMSVGLQVVL